MCHNSGFCSSPSERAITQAFSGRSFADVSNRVPLSGGGSAHTAGTRLLRRNTAGEVSAGGSGQTVETRLLRRNAAGAVCAGWGDWWSGTDPHVLVHRALLFGRGGRATSLERGGCGTEIHALVNVLFLRGWVGRWRRPRHRDVDAVIPLWRHTVLIQRIGGG